MDKIEFKGVIPALMTPSDRKDRTDFHAMEKHIEYLISKRITGLYITGSTGEGFQMSPEERNSVVEAVCAQVDGRIPVIAHTGAISTIQAVEMSNAAEKAGADAISSVPPFYYNFSEKEIIDYYRDLAGSTKLPLFIYNIPATTGIDLSLKTFEELFNIPGIIGLKFTSPDIYKMERVINLKSKPVVFSGCDEMSYYGLLAGADAVVGSSYNLVADTVVTMYNALIDGQHEKAHANYRLASEILFTLLNFPYFAAVRKVLEWDGCPIGEPRKPFRPLDTEEQKKLREALKDVLNRFPEGTSSLRQNL